MKTVLRWGAWLALALLVAALAAAGLAWAALRPKPGEWATDLPVGRWRVAASVPTLLRWATHPLARPELHGRTIAARSGRWHLASRNDGAIEARCAPCALHLAALGEQPLGVAEARIVLHARGADRFDGTLHVGDVAMPWRGELHADGLALHAELAPTPVARLVAALGVAEAATARIDGRFALVVDARLDAGGLQIQRVVPRLEGVAVDRLGTEALVDADALGRCRPQPGAGRVEGWLPHAVVAAEDQRFHEHPGYEIDAWVAALRHNAGQPDALLGGSTITMQLAKILYTGDERSANRKIREWLYAVEMERTLGKGRILQLYLATVPWGDGVCGAEAAARHHLGKPTAQLRPREAAFLASLLVNPDAQVRRWAADDPAARERAAFVLRGMKRLPRERREAELDALAQWQPPIGRGLLLRPGAP
jgi:hypothetical protein